jgi:secondary thiamine-phosphate synthase enzyme
MKTLAQPTACRHISFQVTSTHLAEFIDITDRVRSIVAASSVDMGLVNVQTLHTTTAIVVNEHEPLLFSDFERMLETIAPRVARYRHDSEERTVNAMPGERVNGHAHCRALLLAPSACLNVIGGVPLLGRWQRIFFVELDGPRDREVSVLVLESAR